MYILGYSGIHEAVAHKSRLLPEVSIDEAHMSQGLDAAAALIADGVILAAAAEERFNGEKHSDRFPQGAIAYCLREAGIRIEEVERICHGFDHGPYRRAFERGEIARKRYEELLSPERQSQVVAQHLGPVAASRFTAVRHHAAHAASAFYPSGFDDALVLIVDGMGEMHSMSVFRGRETRLELLKQSGFLSSVGMLYSVVTKHLGFSPCSDEYKVMGLAPYGDPERFLRVLAPSVELGPRGEVNIPLFLLNRTPLEKETYRALDRWLSETCFPARRPDEPISREHEDLAAALQHVLNHALLHVLRFWKEETGASRLCMAGGVALNCTANGIILRSGLFEDVCIPPAAGDDGTSIGAALHEYYRVRPDAGRVRMGMPLYGPEASEEEIAAALAGLPPSIEVRSYPEGELVERAAQLIADGLVVGWMQGRMEFGPRALGSRSILADPRMPDMRDRVNAMVKLREGFRPFAPAAAAEKAHLYFEIRPGERFPYMLFTVPVRPEYRPRLPAITHVDGSARLQTVSAAEQPLFSALLEAFERRSGLPILLNTSFNIKGQPIVRTAEEAVQTFLKTGISAVVIGNHVAVKKGA